MRMSTEDDADVAREQGSFMAPTAGVPTADGRPNVVWIIADQWRAQAAGYAGDPNVCTPNLDRLAAEGCNFSRAIAGTPLCCPSRGSMLTGRFPHHSGVLGHEEPLPQGMPTVATQLRSAGYRTCYVGKWHLDGDRPDVGAHSFGDEWARVRMIPPERRAGFDDWWAYENNNRPFDCLVHTDSGMTPLGAAVIAKESEMEQFRLPGYETDGLTDLMLAWLNNQIEARREQPFFAVLSVQPPHNPYVAPAENMAHYSAAAMILRDNVPPNESVRRRASRDLAGYYAAIERFDLNLGRVREALDQLGIADNTYLVITGDHGDMLGSHGQWHKTTPWEESIRVPLLVGGPSRDHQTRTELDVPIGLVDLAPTTLGLCGLAIPAEMDGTDHSWLVTDATMPATNRPSGAYISTPMPTGHPNSIDRPWRGVVTEDRWKYVTLDGAPWLMFDLEDDPLELVNLAHNPGAHQTRNRLEDHLAAWVHHTNDLPDPKP